MVECVCAVSPAGCRSKMGVTTTIYTASTIVASELKVGAPTPKANGVTSRNQVQLSGALSSPSLAANRQVMSRPGPPVLTLSVSLPSLVMHLHRLLRCSKRERSCGKVSGVGGKFTGTATTPTDQTNVSNHTEVTATHVETLNAC